MIIRFKRIKAVITVYGHDKTPQHKTQDLCTLEVLECIKCTELNTFTIYIFNKYKKNKLLGVLSLLKNKTKHLISR